MKTGCRRTGASRKIRFALLFSFFLAAGVCSGAAGEFNARLNLIMSDGTVMFYLGRDDGLATGEIYTLHAGDAEAARIELTKVEQFFSRARVLSSSSLLREGEYYTFRPSAAAPEIEKKPAVEKAPPEAETKKEGKEEEAEEKKEPLKKALGFEEEEEPAKEKKKKKTDEKPEKPRTEAKAIEKRSTISGEELRRRRTYVEEASIEDLGGYNEYTRFLGTVNLTHTSSGGDSSFSGDLNGAYRRKRETLNDGEALRIGSMNNYTASNGSSDFFYGLGGEYVHKRYTSETRPNFYFLGGKVSTGNPYLAIAQETLSVESPTGGTSVLSSSMSELWAQLLTSMMGISGGPGAMGDEKSTFAYAQAGIGTGRVINISTWNRIRKILLALQDDGLVKEDVPRNIIQEMVIAIEAYPPQNPGYAIAEINRILSDNNLLVNDRMSTDTIFEVAEIYDESLKTLESGYEYKIIYLKGLTKDDKSSRFRADVVFKKPLTLASVYTFTGSYESIKPKGGESFYFWNAGLTYEKKLSDRATFILSDFYCKVEDSKGTNVATLALGYELF
ncbi:MAG: hypothetical protein AB1742_07285 [bacterium]